LISIITYLPPPLGDFRKHPKEKDSCLLIHSYYFRWWRWWSRKWWRLISSCKEC